MTNPFTEQVISVQPVNAIEAISRAEIDRQIATAKQYPRSLARVKAEMIEMATLDEETAASCFYNLPRGGKNISGPSIRLAEIAFACYGNISSVTRVIEAVVDGAMPFVTVQSICKDLEKNNTVGWEKRRRIVGKKSKGGIIDEDDIQLAANAGGAITFRDTIFKIVPPIIWKPVYEAARKVAIGDARTLVDRRQRAIEAFAKMGVPTERVLTSIERTKVEEITLEDLEALIGTFTAIKEGSVSIENAFPLPSLKSKEPKKVERPDFGKEPIDSQMDEPPSAEEDVEQTKQSTISEPGAPPVAAKRERKVKTAAEEKKPLESPHKWLAAELDEYTSNPDYFVAGLKLIEFPGISKDVESFSQVDDPICQAIIDKGVRKLVEEIRTKRWVEGTK